MDADDGESRIPDAWYGIFEKIKARKELEEEVAAAGGNKYQQLQARLTDQETGKLLEDIVIYAIRTIDDKDEAESFLHGYAEDIAAHPEKYPGQARDDPAGYARYDTGLALNMHFTSSATHELWDGVLETEYDI